MPDIKYYIGKYISDEKELDSFGSWAFGDECLSCTEQIKYMECWNCNHGKELTLYPDGWVANDAPKMVELWEKYKLVEKK